VTQRTQQTAPHPRANPPGRNRAAGYFVAALLAAAVVAGLVAVLSSGGGGGSSGATDGAFGTHYAGLEERRVQAGVPTMSDSSTGGAHIHPQLAVYVRGNQISLPANIGIDPSKSLTEMAGLHTHDSSGVIHVENAANPTLAQFFQVWGVPFSSTQLGPNHAKNGDVVRMWVDGKASQTFGALPLEDGQRIVVSFGPANAAPPPSVGASS
jgi:hypothetical protein